MLQKVHFRLTFVAQKRSCLSSLINPCFYYPLMTSYPHPVISQLLSLQHRYSIFLSSYWENFRQIFRLKDLMIVIIFSNDLFMIWANCAWCAILQLRNEILNYQLQLFLINLKMKNKNKNKKQNKIACIPLSCSEVFIGAGFKTCPFRFFAFFLVFWIVKYFL